MTPTWGAGQITRTKELRAKTGLGLREAHDLTSKYPTLSVDGIIAQLAPAQKAEPEEQFSSDLQVRGWLVVSKRFPELCGYQSSLSEETRELLKNEESAVLQELVFKSEADALIDETRKSGRGPVG
jgi:hypothetical protein